MGTTWMRAGTTALRGGDEAYCQYYNHVRSHSSQEHKPPLGILPDEHPGIKREQIVIRTHVGGLIKSFSVKAA